MTLYGSYGSSLQQGDVAPTTVANAGEALAPYRSRQTEAGYKIRLSRVNISTAVFWLERPFANIDPADNVVRIVGDQINYGVEATLSGRVLQRLVLYGSAWTAGFDVLDLSMRYSPLVLRRQTTWRLTVNNVTDTHYWSTLGPGNITGTNVGSYTGHLGAPRTVSASMEVAF